MKYIKVTIDKENNSISVKNGGKGIPIEIHKEYNIYVPQLIFGNLLTSSNYNDDIKKTTGGRNGYGAKLTNIFSKKFIVETADKKNGKIYKQIFSNNMLKVTEPEIKKYNKEDFTCITFQPDLQKFKMDKLDNDIISLFIKRVYDMSGVTPKSVNVYYNEEKINIRNFQDYISMYTNAIKDEDEEDAIIYYEQPNERWEIGMSLSESQFQQVSFVNSISTSKGGTHVNYVTDKIVQKILEVIQKKNKTLNIKPQHVKQHIWIFVNCLIENPAFDSQTKETLTTKKDEFGSSFDLSDKYVKQILNSGIIERCLRYAKTREEERCLKKLNGKNKKSVRLLGIEKLDDANLAGTRNSDKCTLILTEGDSAKSLAMAGIEVVGRDTFGCFPLRGKMLNVREAPPNKIAKNQEVQYLMKILGIRIGENYTDVKNLRYGSIMIMTDQDVDGSHIKGLIINFIHTFWPSLIKINGFLKQFITPIIKASKGNEIYSFYTLPEYKQWVEKRNKNIKGFKIKYYKGLGTSTSKEAQEYFSNIDKHRIYFDYTNDIDDESIDMAFNKKKTEERKNWLMKFDPNSPPLDLDIDKISYQEFINRELVLFSLYDNQRSIPSLCDGLKPSERKILYGCFKRNLKDEVKVAQLIGYISEHSAYHHGEQSLASTIVGMSQNYVGTNNINLLMPIGQFGTRNLGGKDCASARYIYTSLNKVTRHIFNSNDFPLMNYIVEEGQKIEPNYYLPIIPMILVNGTEGIGTGWSTNVPCFNPREIIQNLKNKLNGGNFTKMHPWYKGFTGDIIEDSKKGNGSYIVNGKYYWDEKDPNVLHIIEIPLKKWTRDYKNFLQGFMGIEVIEDKDNDKKGKKGKGKKNKNNDGNEEKSKEKKKKPIILEDIKQNHSNNKVHFEIKFLPEFTEKFKENDALLIKTFGLQSTLSLTNMVLFDQNGKIKRYTSIEEILNIFYDLRLELYDKRKVYMLSILKKDLGILSNKVRFIKAVISEELILKNKKRAILVNELLDSGYDTMSKLEKLRKKSKEEEEAEIEIVNQNLQNENEENEEDNLGKINDNKKSEIKQKVPAKEYDYLLTMPLWSLTFEKVEELLKQKEEKEKEFSDLEKTDREHLWMNDLDELLLALDKFEKWEEEQNIIINKNNSKIQKNTKRNNRKNNKKNKEDILNNEQVKKKNNKRKNSPSTIESEYNTNNKNIEEVFRPSLKDRLKNKKEKDFTLTDNKKTRGPLDEILENMEFMDGKSKIIEDE